MKNLVSIIGSKDYHDCILEAQGKQIYAHKVVLTSRCEFFRAMFCSSWAETKSPSVSLKCDFDVLQAVIYYLYSDQLDERLLTDETVVKVLIEAHALVLQRLKELCELYIIGRITAVTVQQLFEVGITYEAKQLQKQCKLFARANGIILRALQEKEDHGPIEEQDKPSRQNWMSCFAHMLHLDREKRKEGKRQKGKGNIETKDQSERQSIELKAIESKAEGSDFLQSGDLTSR